jgi:hypothetical protein
MSRGRKYFFIPLLFLLFLVSVDAAHGHPPHARHSLTFKKGVHRRVDVSGVNLLASVSDVLNAVVNGPPSPSGQSL